MSLLSELIKARRRMVWTREEIEAHQLSELRFLVVYAIKHSPFYRDLYKEAGITLHSAHDVKLRDLPIVDKHMIMDHFDDVVTGDGLTRAGIEEWIAQNPGLKNRMNGYKILHSSGTSGRVGFYAYDTHAWNTLKATVMAYIALYQRTPFEMLQKNRLAYFAATHGLFAGVTLVSDAPKFLYDVKTFSVLDPFDEVLQGIQKYQPTQLGGYSSTITQLAQAKLDGRLDISPRSALVGGDPMTEHMRSIVMAAWPNIQLTDFYAASESIGIAARRPGESLYTIFDDLHIVEILDDANAEVLEDESGSVVMTNLYNRTLPLIRYKMGDVATRGPLFQAHTTFKKIDGRVNESLPITGDNGVVDSIHPIALSEFFVPGVQRVQFISHSPTHITVSFVGPESKKSEVAATFQKLLQMKDASQKTDVEVQNVASIHNNKKTGKYQLVVKA